MAWRPKTLLALPLLVVVSLAAAAQGPASSPAQIVMDSVDLYVEVDQPERVVGAVLDSTLAEGLRQLGLTDDLAGDEGVGKLRAAFDALKPALAGRVGFALRSQPAGTRFLIVSENRGGLDVAAAAGLVAGLDEKLEASPVDDVYGHPWCDIQGLGAVAGRDGYLLMSNHPFFLRRTLRLKPASSVAARTDYRQITGHRGSRQIVAVGNMAKLLRKNDALDSPTDLLGVLLAQGLVDDLRSAERASLWASLAPWPELHLKLEGVADAGAAWKRAGRSFRLPRLPADALGVLHLDRDLAHLWSKRFDLVPEGGHQGIAGFSQAMNTFFSGFPFDDVMSHVEPGYDLIVAANRSGANERPDIALPSFAAVFDTTLDDELADRFRVAFQTAIGVINAGAAEEQRQPMLQVSRTVGGVEILGARFLSDPRDGRKKTEYNFTPSMAFVGSRLVLSSDLTLAGDVVAGLAEGPDGRGRKRRGDYLEIRAEPVAAALRANLEVLAEQQVLEKGLEMDEARRRIGLITDVVDRFGLLQLEHRDGQAGSEWHLRLTGREEAR